MNRVPGPGPGSEAAVEGAVDDGLDALGPLTPTPVRASAPPDGRPPWGRLEGFAARAVLRLLEAEGKDCTMTLQEGGRRALVHLRAGRPVHAECGSLTGLPAFDDVLGWADPIVSIARLRYEGTPTFEPSAPERGAAQATPGAPERGATRAAAPSAQAPAPHEGGPASRPAPYERLLRLAEAGETGELVVAQAAAEFHVHLQRGRVVWVSERHTRERFRRHLLAVAGTRDEDLRPVLEECRRSRLPLVETLVGRKLATPDQLRETFAAVFRDALAELRALPEGACVFLRRGAEARHDMSFPLRGLEPAPEGPSEPPPAFDAEAEPATLAAPAAPAAAPPPRESAPREPTARGGAEVNASAPREPAARGGAEASATTPPAPDVGPATLSSGSSALPFTAEELKSALEKEGVPVEGVCLTRGLAIVPGASSPAMVPPPGLLDLMGGPANERAELVVLRAADATIIGQRIGNRPLVAWCRTRPDSYAAAQSLLARLGGAVPAPRVPLRPPGKALRVHHNQVPTDASAELTKLFTDNADLLSALAADASARAYLAVDGPSAPSLTWMLRRALSAAGVVGPLWRDAPPEADAPPPMLGARFAEGWWFGGPLVRDPGHFGWLLLQPAAAQALGWLMAGRYCRRFSARRVAALDA